MSSLPPSEPARPSRAKATAGAARVRGWVARRVITAIADYEPRPFEVDGRTFERPHRTVAMHTVNKSGRLLRGLGLVRPLTFENVIAAAERNAGLSEWGGDEIHAPLRLLVDSLEQEAALTPLGRLFMRAGLAHFGANRLRLERLVRRHPEIREERIERPLFIVGLPRTGSTLLYELLALDPALRPLLNWEVFWPAMDRGGFGSEPGQRERWVHSVNVGLHFVAPQMTTIHPLRADAPDESTMLMANTFVSWTFSLLARVPRYDDWLWSAADRDTLAGSYRHLKLQLQALQWQRSGGRWLLKSPIHLQSLDALLDVFPDALVIHTRRDPVEAVPSTCSLFAVLRGICSDRIRPPELGQEIAGRLSAAVAAASRVRRRDPERFIDVDYDDLVRDKAGTVERVRERLGSARDSALTEQVSSWLARQGRRPQHRYDLAQFGLTRSRLAELFPQTDRASEARESLPVTGTVTGTGT